MMTCLMNGIFSIQEIMNIENPKMNKSDNFKNKCKKFLLNDTIFSYTFLLIDRFIALFLINTNDAFLFRLYSIILIVICQVILIIYLQFEL